MEKQFNSVNEIPIFLSSADSYADIWPAFFFIFKRSWPEYKGTIYLNTQSAEYRYDGLNIVCTKLGPQRFFGETFLAGVNRIKSDNYLLLMIDYFFEGRVDVDRLQGLYDTFLRNDLDTLTLTSNPPAGSHPATDNELCVVLENENSHKVMFGFQAAFWKKGSIDRLIGWWENPWKAEYFGSQRAEKFGSRFYALRSLEDMPIKYDWSGVLHGGGRWYDPALKKIDFTGVPIDFGKSKRKKFDPRLMTRWHRLPGELRGLHWRALSQLSLLSDNIRTFGLGRGSA